MEGPKRSGPRPHASAQVRAVRNCGAWLRHVRDPGRSGWTAAAHVASVESRRRAHSGRGDALLATTEEGAGRLDSGQRKTLKELARATGMTVTSSTRLLCSGPTRPESNWEVQYCSVCWLDSDFQTKAGTLLLSRGSESQRCTCRPGTRPRNHGEKIKTNSKKLNDAARMMSKKLNDAARMMKTNDAARRKGAKGGRAARLHQFALCTSLRRPSAGGADGAEEGRRGRKPALRECGPPPSPRCRGPGTTRRPGSGCARPTAARAGAGWGSFPTAEAAGPATERSVAGPAGPATWPGGPADPVRHRPQPSPTCARVLGADRGRGG